MGSMNTSIIHYYAVGLVIENKTCSKNSITKSVLIDFVVVLKMNSFLQDSKPKQLSCLPSVAATSIFSSLNCHL